MTTSGDRQGNGEVPGNAEELAEEIFRGLLSTMEIFNIYVGVRGGLYEALAAHDTLTPDELAEAASIHPRYAREWLEQQAVAGVLEAPDQAQEAEDADPYRRRFRLPAEHRRVLTSPDDPLYLAAGPLFMLGIAEAVPHVLAAFRTGEGVPYARYGRDSREGTAGLNRPMFRNDLVRSWLGALPDVLERLAVPGARIVDLGCGVGWSTLAMAEAFPAAQVTGVDLDPASIEQALANAAEAGLAKQVEFSCGDAALLSSAGGAELVTVFEALHDMSDPVAALKTARGLLGPTGVVLIGDEKVEDRFTAPGPTMERFNYAFSVLHCLPATRAENAQVEAGTILRADTVAAYAREAGFAGCEVLDIDHDLWRFYRLGG
ncbi:methyltransferase domain-containing protein [Streptomyces sp. NBC_01352]|uniref:class I SAM-dependent methyltransferase n=1 Tax=unclassified Streptomyces TaxID=2593676 RepID=UPI00225B16A0|nr:MULTISPECIES: class I SAM-dependent methyltransferase [unclassified Streptomyces]MCX4701183.1 methyltransferase domain-containing protein [Streptomyces sp. NBC_01373]